MSLRLRLFLLFGSLVALLVLAQWWWVRTLTRDLSAELDEVASSVGRSVVAFFNDWESAPRHKVVECLGEGCEDLTTGGHEGHGATHDVEVVRFDSDDEVVHRPGGEVIVRKMRRAAPASESDEPEPGEHYAYTYEVEDHVLSGEDSEHAEIKKHVKIHIEHEGGSRFLWMGGPSMTRRFQIPQRGLHDKLERFSQRLVFGSIGFLALGLMLAGAVAHRVTTPLRRLSDAAREVGDGVLGTRVPVSADGEVGEAIRAFNQMSGRLEELDSRSREHEARKHLGEIGELARGLAHTLRNPLNALGLSVEELAAGSSGDAAPDLAPQKVESATRLPGPAPPRQEPSATRRRLLAESARRQIRRIDQSIRSFLALASQSGGVLAEIDLGELIQDVGLEALQDSRGKVRLDLDLAPGFPRLAAVEPELRAVLQALVVNAVEASPESGQVTVRASASDPGRWRVEVEDEGPGLAPEVRRRLFTPHLSTKANGSGMGLFLAHRIATNRYGGSLELVDRGSGAGGTRAVLELGERATTDSGEGGDE